MTTKQENSVQKFSGRARAPGNPNWSTYSFSIKNTSSSTGASHKGWKHAGASDIGGPWFLDRTYAHLSPCIVKTSHNDGPYYVQDLNSFPGQAFVPISDTEIKSAGTSSIKIATPNNPTAKLAVFLGELHSDGLPSIIGSDALKEKTRYLHNSGSEYLNVQFGWLPMVSDLQSFARAIKHHNKIIDGYRKGSDHKIRRRRSLEPARTFLNFNGSGYLQPVNGGASMLASGSQTQESLTESWFSGAFRYHLPVGDDTWSELKRYESYANKLLGARLTPATVWQVAPWLWATDWFTSMGTIMSNISNLGTDGMVMQYGYQMLHRKQTTTVSFTYNGSTGNYRRIREQKRRIPASPYSFTTTFDGMTNRQKAICAALGLTRVR